MSTYIPAWTEEEGTMKPAATHVHVIPLEERPDLLHCAQQHCWCSPAVDEEDSRLLIHNAVTAAPEGWVKIAENRAATPPAHALPLPTTTTETND